MNKNKEFILCAAINFNGVIVCGLRHGDCYGIIKSLLSPYISPIDLPLRDEQGFLTSKNRFINREEAFLMAKENNQICHHLFDKDETGTLISEDLY